MRAFTMGAGIRREGVEARRRPKNVPRAGQSAFIEKARHRDRCFRSRRSRQFTSVGSALLKLGR